MIASHLVPAAMVSAAIAPALLLLWLVVAADSRPQPARLVSIAVVLGALSMLVAAAVELGLQRYLPMPQNPWLAAGVNALLLAAIPEETLKIALIAAIALRSRDFDEPMDGVVYGTAVGLGFAALENFFYVTGDANWQSVAVLRGVLTVPLHGAFGAIAGAYIARARFTGKLGFGRSTPWRLPRLFVLAWLVPVVLHAAFDAAVFSLQHAATMTGDTDAANLAAGLAVLAGAIIGFGTIVFAALLTRRISRRQRGWITPKRLPVGHWRHVWAECLLGVGFSFVGVALLIAGEPGAKFLGALLIAAAAGLSWKCAKHLNDAAKSRRHAAAAAVAP